MLRFNAAARAELIRRLPHVQEEVSAASAATRTDTAAMDPATQATLISDPHGGSMEDPLLPAASSRGTSVDRTAAARSREAPIDLTGEPSECPHGVVGPLARSSAPMNRALARGSVGRRQPGPSPILARGGQSHRRIASPRRRSRSRVRAIPAQGLEVRVSPADVHSSSSRPVRLPFELGGAWELLRHSPPRLGAAEGPPTPPSEPPEPEPEPDPGQLA